MADRFVLENYAFYKWMEELMEVAIRSKVQAEFFYMYRWQNRKAWEEYYDSGMNPQEAFLEDLQHV